MVAGRGALVDMKYFDSSLQFTQDKWFKKVIGGEISITEVAYTLKITSNKRAPIYFENVFENTKPFNYDE